MSETLTENSNTSELTKAKAVNGHSEDNAVDGSVMETLDFEIKSDKMYNGEANDAKNNSCDIEPNKFESKDVNNHEKNCKSEDNENNANIGSESEAEKCSEDNKSSDTEKFEINNVAIIKNTLKVNSTEEIEDSIETKATEEEKTAQSENDESKNHQTADEESDIEMLEETDPLAISDTDVKELSSKEEPKQMHNIEITKRCIIPDATPSSGSKVKKKTDANLIIINTNNLLKNAGSSLTLTPATPKPTPPPATPPSTTTQQVNLTSSVQAALSAFSNSNNPNIQGLQNVYLNAIQQVLLSQNHQNSPGSVGSQQTGELQDEAYVIEAPSFIVPYVMEGKPEEAIQDYLQRIKEEEEAEKKRRKEAKKEKNKGKNKGESGKDKQAKIKLENEESKEKSEQDGLSNSKFVEKESIDDSDKNKVCADANEINESTEDTEMANVDNKNKEDNNKEEDEDDKVEKTDGENKVDETEDKKSDSEEKNSDKQESKKKKKRRKIGEDVDEDSGTEEMLEKQVANASDSEDSESSSGEDGNSGDEEVGGKKKDDSDKENSEEKKDDLSYLGRWEPFYRSTLGKFFVDLGLSQVKEYIQSDLLRMQKRKFDKMKSNPNRADIAAFEALKGNLKQTQEHNAHLHTDLKTCKFCTFKTESELVMKRHLESPHMSNYTYNCNFCRFETRGPQVILFHMEAEHNVRGRLERAPAFFQCPLCPYEDNTKSKMTRHSVSCLKRFKADKNLELPDWEPPAKIPKAPQRSGRAGSLRSFDNKMPIFPKNFGNLAAANHLAASMQALASGRGRGRPVGSYKNIAPMGKGVLYPQRSALLNSLSGLNSQYSFANQVLQSVNNKAGSTKSPQQPSISITPLPRAGQTGTKTMKDGTKSTFVICEICDGYIKDLEQLRNHMNLIHKVKIHPKMIYNRPPLNCQKCQQRFFTDQGLERHLLGTHGLVTSSMQEAANKGKDSGRCPICGKVFQWKLLNHVNKDHKLTLKPAHLSYKCTVCTATFNMYRLFENHVYSAHSVVNKNKGGESSGTGKKPSGPLKINDEITIIPQPTVKKSEAKPTTTGKEITITKVNSSSSSPVPKKSGVELISIEDSPNKRQPDDDGKRKSKRIKT